MTEIRDLLDRLNEIEDESRFAAIKPALYDRCAEIYELELSYGDLVIQNWNDIEIYFHTKERMLAYNADFTQNVLIPYFNEHNPATLSLLNIAVLFYSQIVCECLTKSYIKLSPELKAELRAERISIYDYVFTLLGTILTERRSQRDFSIYGLQPYFLDDESFENIQDMVWTAIERSHYWSCLKKCIGRYRVRFTKTKYIADFQSIILGVLGNYKNICK